MSDSYTTTQLLSLFFGLYALFAGLGMLFDRQAIPSMFDTMAGNAAIGFLTGIVAFVVGAVIVSVHQNWTGLLASTISIVGWIAILEGLAMLSFRKQFLGAFAFLVKSQTAITISALLAVLVGVVFIWSGLAS